MFLLGQGRERSRDPVAPDLLEPPGETLCVVRAKAAVERTCLGCNRFPKSDSRRWCWLEMHKLSKEQMTARPTSEGDYCHSVPELRGSLFRGGVSAVVFAEWRR